SRVTGTRASKCAIPAASCRPTCWSAWGRRSSPPASRAPASAWRWRGRPSRSTAARWSTTARKAAARSQPARCRSVLSRKGGRLARLLLVDDEPAMLFALKELAESRKHETVLAKAGEDALAVLEGVDAVVSDYAMPGMDGVQLL